MLLQSLLLVVTLAIIGSALLTSTLVRAKATFHTAIVATGRSAMTDATADFIAWTQSNIRDNGIDQLPVWAAKPQTSGPQPACRGTTSAPASNSSSNCKLFQSIDWNVTGFTDSSTEFRSTSLGSEATNLATAQNERRISATVNIAITDATGSIIYSRESRELTARVFHAFPYIALTGERDASSESGSIVSAEGDTGGFSRDTKFKLSTDFAPNPIQPASYTKTQIVTTIDCENTINNASSNPELDNNNVIYSQLRAYGNLAWTYEVPCQSVLPINAQTAPHGYAPAIGNVYGTTASADIIWNKHDEDQSTFAH